MRRSSTPFYIHLIYVGIFCIVGFLGYFAFYDLNVPVTKVVQEIPFEKLPKN